MKQIIRVIFVIITVVILLNIYAYAETIVLKTGKVIKGKVIERAGRYIKVDAYGVVFKFYYDEVKSIIPDFFTFTSPQADEQEPAAGEKKQSAKEASSGMTSVTGWKKFRLKLDDYLGKVSRLLDVYTEEERMKQIEAFRKGDIEGAKVIDDAEVFRRMTDNLIKL